MKITEQKHFFRMTRKEEIELFKTVQKAVKFGFSAVKSAPAQADNKYVKYKNIFSTVKIILQEEGLRGFLRGLGANVTIVAPSAAISWASYEQIKGFLFKLNQKSLPF